MAYREPGFFDYKLNLPNGNRLEREWQKLDSLEQISLISFEIDDLSDINGIYGRELGDRLLMQIRNWLLSIGDAAFDLYRSGDAFCLLVRDAKPEGANALAQRLYRRFAAPWHLGRIPPVYCHCSMAVLHGCEWPRGQYSIRRLLTRSVNAGRTGRGVLVYTMELDQSIRRHHLRRQRLRHCIQFGMEGFSVHYQPIVRSDNGQWRGLEALCRWEHPQIGPVGPDIFIGEVEQLGLIGKLGDWVLNTALDDCKRWKLDSLAGFMLDVNISPLQVVDHHLVDRVADALHHYGFSEKKLSLEVTESREFNFTGRNIGVLNQLRNMGVGVALDDFGTGYCSFSNLQKLPASILKMDKSLIDDLETDIYLQHLVKVLVELAHSAGMALVAEGVETPRQQELLWQFGADYMQGYLFSPPLAPSDLEAKLDKFAFTGPPPNLC